MINYQYIALNERNIMHIQLEARNLNSITSYDESQLIINQVTYKDSLIVSRQDIVSNWPCHSLKDLSEAMLLPIINMNPEVLILGHTNPQDRLPISIQQWLSQQRLGVECMLIGAACRTFNVLLSENRHVVVGFVFR